MYSLRVTCAAGESEFISAELWEWGTVAIGETEDSGRVTLLAGFETNRDQAELLRRFAAYTPEWRHEPERDWIAETQAAWPARAIGRQLFLAPVWSTEPTPAGRTRMAHNPGLACGTGEHPCTQLALQALEQCVTPGCRVVDVGTGSGLLAIAAIQLGARWAIGVDPDVAVLGAARENFELNGLAPHLAAGSADCLRSECADVTVANISGTVLLAIWEDVLRVTRIGGWLISTGFPQAESGVFERLLPGARVFEQHEWRCVVARRFGL